MHGTTPYASHQEANATDCGYPLERIRRNEVALLGGLILRPDCINTVAGLVQPQYFRDPTYSAIYSTLLELSRSPGDFDDDMLQCRLLERIPRTTSESAFTVVRDLIWDVDGRQRYTSEIIIRDHAKFIAKVGRRRRYKMAATDLLHASENGHTDDELLLLAKAATTLLEDEHPTTDVVCLADIQAEPVTWFWEPWIPAGQLTEIIAPGGLGKSTLVALLMANVTTGKRQYGHDDRTTPANVLLLAEDEAASVIKPRFLAAGGDPTRLFLPRIDTLDSAGMAQLRRHVVTYHPALLTIDPPEDFIPQEVDTNNAKDLRVVFLKPLTDLAHETRTTTLFVRNTNKNETASGSHRGSGSHAWRDAVRSSIHVGYDPQDMPNGRIVVQDKSNLGQFATPLAYTIQPAAIHVDETTTIPTSRIVWRGKRPDMAGRNILAAGRAVDDKVDDIIRFVAGNPGCLRVDIRKAKLPGLGSGSAVNKAVELAKNRQEIFEDTSGKMYETNGKH